MVALDDVIEETEMAEIIGGVVSVGVGGGAALNVAVTLFAAFIVTVHEVPDTDEQPLQLAKVEPVDGVAVKVTEVPELNEALQVAPQLMPVGDEVTVPEPVLTPLETVRVYWVVGLGRLQDAVEPPLEPTTLPEIICA